MLTRRAGFPCFIQTSYNDAALQRADDVNRVYSKNPNADGGGREELMRRIAIQIEHHRRQVAGWVGELEGLLAVDRADLSAKDIERMLELDGAIEANFGHDATIASEAKRDLLRNENLAARQNELLGETEKLIAEMRQALHG